MSSQNYLAFGLETIKKSRALILKRLGTEFKVSTKADSTLVTEVDREAEKLLRSEIEHNFPDHGIVGEEFGTSKEEAEFKWSLDPIDGTISFSRGIPLYGTIMALYQGDHPVVGIIDLPGLGQCYYATPGHGTFCNGERVAIQDTLNNFENEVIATGDISQFKNSRTMKAYEKLLNEHTLTRTIPDCFGHSLAITGAVGAMVDFYINVWDMAATQLLIEEAGGKFVLHRKTALDKGKFKYDIICGKPQVVEWLTTFFSKELG
jgi:myo-inositol-1(or 4)-monophosphatase